jgi:acetyl esterase/lipase
MDPCTHRLSTTRLAQITGGRCFLPRYRLAPQQAFPTQLLDCLVSYLYLLYPPPGSLHTPVSPAKICFAGDSAGGNLCLALTQLILELQRQSNGKATVKWYGEDRELPLPAGVAVNSPYVDVSRSLESEEANVVYDYLPSPSQMRKKRPACAIWPANPPRQNMYCDDSQPLHPLVSPITAKNWKGAPPMYLATGEECLTDGDVFIAKYLQQQGVKLIFEQFEAMPHCFAMIMPQLPQAKRYYASHKRFFELAINQPHKIETSAVTVKPGQDKGRDLDLRVHSKYTMDSVRRMMKQAIYDHEAGGLSAKL